MIIKIRKRDNLSRLLYRLTIAFPVLAFVFSIIVKIYRNLKVN